MGVDNRSTCISNFVVTCDARSRVGSHCQLPCAKNFCHSAELPKDSNPPWIGRSELKNRLREGLKFLLIIQRPWQRLFAEEKKSFFVFYQNLLIFIFGKNSFLIMGEKAYRIPQYLRRAENISMWFRTL